MLKEKVFKKMKENKDAEMMLNKVGNELMEEGYEEEDEDDDAPDKA